MNDPNVEAEGLQKKLLLDYFGKISNDFEIIYIYIWNEM